MTAADDKRLERAERRAAAANKECEALRREVSTLRHANYILRLNDENSTEGNYRSRYEKLAEAMRIVREVASIEVNGIPDEPPKTLAPWLGPKWARKKGEADEQ